MFHVVSPTFETFQERVASWFKFCFSITTKELQTPHGRKKRNHVFLEEALELVQACDCTKEEALALVEYVFNRPKGERVQEVGGVVTTLTVLCEVWDIDLRVAAETELARIQHCTEQIIAKTALKPDFL